MVLEPHACTLMGVYNLCRNKYTAQYTVISHVLQDFGQSVTEHYSVLAVTAGLVVTTMIGIDTKGTS